MVDIIADNCRVCRCHQQKGQTLQILQLSSVKGAYHTGPAAVISKRADHLDSKSVISHGELRAGKTAGPTAVISPEEDHRDCAVLQTKWTYSCHQSRGRGRLEEPHTAETQYRKFETNIPWKGTAPGLRPNSYIHVSVSDLYSHDQSAYAAGGKYT